MLDELHKILLPLWWAPEAGHPPGTFDFATMMRDSASFLCLAQEEKWWMHFRSADDGSGGSKILVVSCQYIPFVAIDESWQAHTRVYGSSYAHSMARPIVDLIAMSGSNYEWLREFLLG